MNIQQLVTVNVHHPKVQRVELYGDTFYITASNGDYNGTVAMFFSNEEWVAFIDDTNRLRADAVARRDAAATKALDA